MCINQWNRIEVSEINPQLYGQLIIKGQRTYSGAKKISLINDFGQTRQPHAKE